MLWQLGFYRTNFNIPLCQIHSHGSDLINLHYFVTREYVFPLLSCSFHTYDYARHFVSACTRILGFEGTPEGVEDQGRLTRVAAV